MMEEPLSMCCSTVLPMMMMVRMLLFKICCKTVPVQVLVVEGWWEVTKWIFVPRIQVLRYLRIKADRGS